MKNWDPEIFLCLVSYCIRPLSWKQQNFILDNFKQKKCYYRAMRVPSGTQGHRDRYGNKTEPGIPALTAASVSLFCLCCCTVIFPLPVSLTSPEKVQRLQGINPLTPPTLEDQSPTAGNVVQLLRLLLLQQCDWEKRSQKVGKGQDIPCESRT